MQRKTVLHGYRPTSIPVAARRAIAAVASAFALLAIAAAPNALAQSGAITGATVDSQSTGESSLLSSGSFRLDGPGDHGSINEPTDDLHSGSATSLGLQIYGPGSGFTLEPRPAERVTEPAASGPPAGQP